MRNLTIASSLGLLLTATGGAAEPQIEGGGADKFSSGGRSAISAGDVRATEIDAELTHASPATGASGVKNSGGGRTASRAARPSSQSRLADEPRRVAGSLARKEFSTSSVRRAATADVPMSIVKTPLKAAAKNAVGVKRLTTVSGPALEATGSKLNAQDVRN